MTDDTPIGRVIATERHPTTTGAVRFWLSPDVRLKPFDFVRLTLAPQDKHEDIGEFYAIIHEIQQVSDEPSPLSGFVSADFGDSRIEPRLARVVATYADAAVLFNTLDIEMPVPHGAQVHWPTADGVRQALNMTDYNRSTPAGYITMSGPQDGGITIPVDLDADYLVGPEGAHLNISGVSGLATKTSYAMFLVTALQQKQQASEERASFVILNVKGSDLLRLHEESPDLTDAVRADWQKCGLAAEPLKKVTYFYPYADTPPYAQTKLDSDLVAANFASDRAFSYYYSVEEVVDRVRLLVEDIDDPNQTLVSCADYCAERTNKDSSWARFREQIREWADTTPDKKIPVVSWRRFSRLFGQRTRNSFFTEESVRATQRRQAPLRRMLDHLEPGAAVVVDIAQLPDYLQSFVVGDVIDLIRRAKLGDDLDDDADRIDRPSLGTVVLFADELNKFAPRQGQARSITRHLREISERGRSEGIILFGAEQFRTGVDRQVTGNSSTHVFGRTTAVEAARDEEIKGLPGGQTKRVPFLRKGELLVSHTRFSSGTLKLRFPRNAYRQN
ncbi:MAG: hypothetical protein OXG74_03775 [Acidobacteria bacterium]|nr:hypothetical protein [Acidobacteriota bacterium]